MDAALLSQIRLIMANTYALYLKTQNYHWHVKGPQFLTLHAFFEMQYQELAGAVDCLAEQLVSKGQKAPATFKALDEFATIESGDSFFKAAQMLEDLFQDHETLIADLTKGLKLAQSLADEGLASVLSGRLMVHEKTRWMIGASLFE